jgi:hypothetical protein
VRIAPPSLEPISITLDRAICRQIGPKRRAARPRGLLR